MPSRPKMRVALAGLVLLAIVAAAVALLRGGPESLYSADSPWNRAIASGPEVDPGSLAMVRRLVAEVGEKGWPIASARFTNALYYAGAGTRRYDVTFTGPTFTGRKLTGVPVPDEAVVSEDSDGGLVVIDRSSRCEYDFAQARRSGKGWSARFVNGLRSDGTGVYPNAESPSASGFASAAGMILPEELEAGSIEHALAFTMKNTKVGGPVPPAVGSDGRSSLPGAIPEGARLQLDPELDLDRQGLQPWEKTIARALQEYGMYLVDTGGAVALRVQHSASTSYRYPWGKSDYGRFPTRLARHLRVLRLGSQRETTFHFVPNRCAALR